MRYAVDKHKNKAFTLVELLIVIALLAILSGVVVLVMNPSELIKEGRDATRAADLASLTTSISLLQADNPIAFMGTSSIIYVSIPDTDSNCASLGLPPLSPPWTYTCADPLTYRRANGTGWIPVDFTSFSAGSPLSKLPVDPVNTTSTGEHYTYTAGSFKLTALFESVKKANAMGKDGGLDPARYETGDKPTLPVPINGLVGYWKMDEGGGTNTVDASGYGNSGTLSASATWQAGKLNQAVKFDGFSSNDYVDVGLSQIINPAKFTLAAWISPADVSGLYNYIFSNARDCCGSYNGIEMRITTNNLNGAIWNGGKAEITSNTTIANNSGWRFVAYSYDGGFLKLYIDGILDKSSGTALGVGSPASFGSYIGRMGSGAQYDFNGGIDDLRVYNRALSDQEIRTIYEATK